MKPDYNIHKISLENPMESNTKTRSSEPRAKLDQAIYLAKSGKKDEAAEMLRNIVAEQPVNQAAWLWLSAVADDEAEAESALAQAKKINPGHPSLPRAEQWLVHRFSPEPETRINKKVNVPPPRPAETPSPEPQKSKRVFGMVNALTFGVVVFTVIIGLVVLAIGLIFEINSSAQASQPEAFVQEKEDTSALLRAQIVEAREGQNWEQAIAALTQLRYLNPSDPAIEEELAELYYQQGLALRGRGFVDEARVNFEKSLEFSPNNPEVRHQAELAKAYQAGIDSYQEGNWANAIEELETVWATDRTYPYLQDLLYSAHYNHGLARQAAGELLEAKKLFESATVLRPDLSEPRRMIAEIEYAMAPETPAEFPNTKSIEDRLILVGIAEQRMHVYDGEERVFDFVVSTGEPGRETAVGEFEILNKIDMAYASTWNLDMPYWMGIYWAGSLQNGIHSLPIVKHTGYKLWDGYLGQRVSYGCVILSDEDSASLYNWAEVGTKVKIVPSLASWSPAVE